MEYQQTWKGKATPLQRLYWAHTASTRRTSDSGFIGWPTPRAEDAESTGAHRGKPDTMSSAAKLAGWCSPTATDASRGSLPPRDHDTGVPLSQQVAGIAGWCSPSSRDWKDTPGMATHAENPDGSERVRMDQLPRQVVGLAGWGTPRVGNGGHGNPERASDGMAKIEDQVHGIMPDSSSAETANFAGYQLNPRFSLWLMGFPIEWESVGASALRSFMEQATPSSRKRPRPSSQPS